MGAYPSPWCAGCKVCVHVQQLDELWRPLATLHCYCQEPTYSRKLKAVNAVMSGTQCVALFPGLLCLYLLIT